MKVVYSAPIHSSIHSSQPALLHYYNRLTLTSPSACSLCATFRSACHSAAAPQLQLPARVRPPLPPHSPLQEVGPKFRTAHHFQTAASSVRRSASAASRCTCHAHPRQQQISAVLLLLQLTRRAMSRWSACCSSAAARSSTRSSGGWVSLLHAISKLVPTHEQTTQRCTVGACTRTMPSFPRSAHLAAEHRLFFVPRRPF